MQRKITLLDGAVGTSLYAKAAAHGIEEHDPVWVFNLRYPDLVQELCRDYHDAGSTYIMANTFTANRQSVSHFSNYAVADVVTAGVQLARDALQGTGAKVGLAVGALAQLMKPFGAPGACRGCLHLPGADRARRQGRGKLYSAADLLRPFHDGGSRQDRRGIRHPRLLHDDL